MNKWSNKLMLLSLSSPLSEINKLKQQQQQAKQCLLNIYSRQAEHNDVQKPVLYSLRV